ncbi:tripartite tricarboxylate transporter substrate binding protein [Bordetella petrii]|nr:tripartite tricarboxylate transporter substrate binding protein [Bordetella petrii]
MKKIARMLSIAVALGCTAPAMAQADFPAKPVTIVVPFASGGGVDILTRKLADSMSRRLGQQIVVKNVTGAGGNVGTAEVAHAAPDGYTLVMATTGTHTINPAVYAQMPFDANKDFAPITMVASVPNLFVLNGKLPFKSLDEFIKSAKANPGKYSFASFGNGTSNHLSGELLKQLAGINVLHVPYKSATQAVTDLIAGHVDFAFVNTPLALPHVQSGALRALAVTTGKRSEATPQYPSMQEAGLPGFVVESWYGLMAPAGTPDAVIQTLYDATVASLAEPDMAAFFKQNGADVVTMPPKQFAQTILKEQQRWAQIVAKAGARID